MIQPPRWANRFLEWYCNPDLLEEIQGDAFELYDRTVTISKRKADWQFVWNVIRFFRWRNIRRKRIHQSNPSIPIDMFKSYLLTGIRNMVRNATPSAINIIGLSVAVGCAVMVFVMEDTYYNLDAMHTKGDRIGMVVNHMKEGEGVSKWARCPNPLGDLLEENSSVEKVARAGRTGAVVKLGDKVFSEGILFADDSFMDIFDFAVASGNRQCLRNKNEIMMTREMATKYFGNTDVVGQTISMIFNDTYKYDFTIGAVLEDTPANSSIYYDFLVPSMVWQEMNKEKIEDWSVNLGVTYVLMKEGEPFARLAPTFETYKKFQNLANDKRKLQFAEVVPMKEVAEVSYDISGSLSWSNSPAAMVAFGVIAIFLILIACFNYVNVAVAAVSTRLKEIGVRKVVGGGRSEIISQFLVENLLLCTFALIAGTALAYFFLVPGFDSLYPVKIEFDLSSWWTTVGFFTGLLLFIALVSGAYPALYVSSFNAVRILRGKEKFGSKSLFSKTLLTLQFTLSITTIVGCLMFVASSYYFEQKDWGYNQSESIVVPLQHPRQFEELRAAVSSNKNIVLISGGMNHIGKSSKQSVFTHDQQEHAATHFEVGFDYVEAMNLRMKAGRSFDRNIESDRRESVIINEEFAKKMGWTNPLQQSFEMDSVKRYVVGVVDNFYYDDFYAKLEPAMMTITEDSTFRYFVAKTAPGAVNDTENDLEAAWKKVAPDAPYLGILQNQVFDQFLNSNRANNKVIYFISFVALLLVAMGLYGLVSYNLTRRLKEFSIRKVFGANVLQIFRLMNRDYLWIVIIAFALGAPAGAWLMDMLLKAAYPNPVEIGAWPYLVTISVMILTVGATILSQLRRVAVENPTQTLRID